MGNLLSAKKAYDMATRGEFNELRKHRVSPNFTWGEVFVHCRAAEVAAMPYSIFINAKNHADRTMETVRGIFNHHPIIVTSWVRSKQRNELVGGASESRHLFGDGTDFEIVGYQSNAGNYKVQRVLDPLPFMQHCGLEFTGGRWTHVDSRGHYSRFTP